MHIGMGYDVHRLVSDRDLIIGGVKIPYEKGLLGHSDADVLLHAIMDALLGAAALGDIGKHFPDTDPKYKGADSLALMREVGKMLVENRFLIENIDATIIAQAPKMRPYIDEMRQNIADALEIEISQVPVLLNCTRPMLHLIREKSQKAVAAVVVRNKKDKMLR